MRKTLNPYQHLPTTENGILYLVTFRVKTILVNEYSNRPIFDSKSGANQVNINNRRSAHSSSKIQKSNICMARPI